MEEENDDDAMKARISRKIYIPVYLMIIILFFTVAYLQLSGKEVDNLALRAILVFSAAMLVLTEGHRYQNLYAIDPQSIIHVKGILFKTTKRTDLTSISDVELKQNPWQMLLNFGTIEVSVFSKENTTYVRNINNPLNFMTFLQKKMSGKHFFAVPPQGGKK